MILDFRKSMREYRKKEAALYPAGRPPRKSATPEATHDTISIHQALNSFCCEHLSVTVTNTEQVNHDTKKITFAIPPDPMFADSRPVLGVPAGSSIQVWFTPAGRWLPWAGSYAPISDVDTLDKFQLLVKKYPGAHISGHLHSLQSGDELSIGGSYPGYHWYNDYTPSDEPRDLLFIAEGTGIAALYSLTKRILRMEGDKTRIELLWAVHDTRDLVLKSELEQLQRDHPDRLQVTYVVSRPDESQDNNPAKFKKGYINKSVIQEALRRCKTGTIGNGSTKVWLRGPPSMEEALVENEGAFSRSCMWRREPILTWMGVTSEKGVLAELGITAREVNKFDGRLWGPPRFEFEIVKYLWGALGRITSSE
ncbi:unnamed protein product [Zymoseptoria tritici ST99CH_3D7]|uniref:NADH-cytochrome b5 reductase 2 n=1 Tax=Zymoseptoria tritici (strain ST99CH_3D7) TaxID=1276538 RepID=A0A1X7S9Y4_ZYMT9|nr:unnamed protein product [Zymoseptoria tritici ST99CH_3D7]